MNKVWLVVLSLLFSFCLSAQTDYAHRYSLLVSQFGPAGVGVETVLKNWEQVDSLNPELHLAWFNYWFTKSRTEQVVKKAENRYLGNKPVLSLKDSTGTDIYYYQEAFFDDQLYGMAIKSIDRTIELSPDDLAYRFLKANAYMSYEKGSPDMALAYLRSLSQMDGKVWKYEGKEIGENFIPEAFQEYCYTFYSLGTIASMEAFRILSEEMIGLYPDRPDFQNNIGAYYLIGRKDSKKALKQYQKVLKSFPMDYTAMKNCAIITRRAGDRKGESKYLTMLLEVAPDSEKPAIKARLSSL